MGPRQSSTKILDPNERTISQGLDSKRIKEKGSEDQKCN